MRHDNSPVVYAGEKLIVTQRVDMFLRHTFPEIKDLQSEYRTADAHIWQLKAHERPRNTERFLVNWMKREKKDILKRQSVTSVGSGPQIDQRMVCCPNCRFNVPAAGLDKHRKTCAPAQAKPAPQNKQKAGPMSPAELAAEIRRLGITKAI